MFVVMSLENENVCHIISTKAKIHDPVYRKVSAELSYGQHYHTTQNLYIQVQNHESTLRAHKICSVNNDIYTGKHGPYAW